MEHEFTTLSQLRSVETVFAKLSSGARELGSIRKDVYAVWAKLGKFWQIINKKCVGTNTTKSTIEVPPTTLANSYR